MTHPNPSAGGELIENMELSKIKKVYMIGIKGVGMTMLAQFLASKNIEVSGSDVKEKFMTDEVLKKSNVKLIEKFSFSAKMNYIILSLPNPYRQNQKYLKT